MLNYKDGVVYGNIWDNVTQKYMKMYSVENIQYKSQKRKGFFAPYDYKLYHKNKEGIVYFPNGILSIIDEREINYTKANITKQELPFNCNPRDWQSKMLKDFEHRDNGFIVAGTGLGKSYGLAGLIKQKGVKTLVVCPKVTIRDGLYDKFIGVFGEKYVAKYPQESFITIIIGNSFGLYWQELSGKYDMLCIDEAHMNFINNGKSKVTPRLNIYTLFKCKYMFGFTATPSSQYVNTNAFDLVFGHREEYEGETLEPTIISYRYEDGFKSYLNRQDALEKLYESEDRTNKLCDVVKDVMNRKRFMGIVFCDRVELVETIVEKLNSIGVYAEGFTRKTKKRDEVLSRIKFNNGVIVATWQTLGVGFDCPDIDTAFYFSQLKFHGTVAQLVGRILRLKEGKSKPLMIDWSDNLIRHQYYQRSKAYKQYYGIGVENRDNFIINS